MSHRTYHHRTSARPMPMPMPARAKSVTDPLDDRVKATLLIRPHSQGYASSSGSEHEGLSGVLRIDGFFFDDSEDEQERREDAACPDEDKDDDDDANNDAHNNQPSFSSLSTHSAHVIRDMMRASAPPKDTFRRDLHAVIAAAAERHRHHPTTTNSATAGDKTAFRRAVMSALRDAGYNAGLCKSRWGATTGLTAGTYEYIDVVRPGPTFPGERYIVDLGFAAEFQIARPTEDYVRVVAELPQVYVGRPDHLRPALRVLADAAKRSMRETGIHVPPWRKLRYVLAKWLGPYKRTTNAEPATALSSAAAPPFQRIPATAAAHCRAVGFHHNSTFAVPPPGRADSGRPHPWISLDACRF